MITWPYIAGFFDGEGCVSFHSSPLSRRAGLQCSIVQSKDIGLRTLIEVAEFITSYGITCRAYAKNPESDVRDILYAVQVNGWDNGVKFLSLMLPYLRIKKLQAQDAIRYHKVFPYFPVKAVCMLRWESRRANARLRQSNPPS